MHGWSEMRCEGGVLMTGAWENLVQTYFLPKVELS